jgi:hypothetical protein
MKTNPTNNNSIKFSLVPIFLEEVWFNNKKILQFDKIRMARKFQRDRCISSKMPRPMNNKGKPVKLETALISKIS